VRELIRYYVKFGVTASHTGKKIAWYIEKFEFEKENFIFNAFIYVKPVKGFENGSDVSKFRSFNNSTSNLEQDSFGSVGEDLVKTLEDCSTESYSNQVWNVLWWLQSYWLFWNQDKDGCSDVHKCKTSKI